MTIGKLMAHMTLLVAISLASIVQAEPANQLRLTDLFTPEETASSGLGKLSAREMEALNRALERVMVDMLSNPSSPDASDDLILYDLMGRPVAWLEPGQDLTVFLWSGRPVAYMDEESVYGFNGKHLGWFRRGRIHDHEGDIVVALRTEIPGPAQTAPPRGPKQLRPLKGLKELKPLKPLWGISWADLPAHVFFMQGAR